MGSSTTTRNFGMRRFTNIVREGRYRAPAALNLRLGTAVELDPASVSDPQELRQVAAGGAIDNTLGGGGIVGTAGILWYEHDSQTYVGAAAGTLMQDFDTAPAGRMVQMIQGAGTKVWLRNTPLDTTEPGLNFPAVRAAVVMVTDLGFDGAGNIAADDLLAWNEVVDEWALTTVLAEAFLRVTFADNSLDTLDAVLLV
jgi:hypothetical protein